MSGPVEQELDAREGEDVQSAHASARPGWLSAALFTWFTPVLRQGARQPLEAEDLPPAPPHLLSRRLFPAFRHHLKHRLPRSAAEQAATGGTSLTGVHACDLLRATVCLFWRPLAAAAALQLAFTACQLAGPLLLTRLVALLQLLQQGQAGGWVWRAYLCAGAMFCAPVLGAVASASANRRATEVEVGLRAALTALVYSKSLRLSLRAKQENEVGRLVNIMSADVGNISFLFFPWYYCQMVTVPIAVTVIMVLLYLQLGWASLLGVAVLAVTSPTMSFFVRRMTRFRRDMLTFTDERVKRTAQLLAGIRVLKMYVWEAALEAQAMEARAGEVGQLAKALRMRVGVQTMLAAAPMLAAVTSLAAYSIAAPADFGVARVFGALALFGLLRSPFVVLPFLFVQVGTAWVSTKRLVGFLALEERHDCVAALPHPGICLRAACATWGKPPPAAQLAPASPHSKSKAGKAQERRIDMRSLLAPLARRVRQLRGRAGGMRYQALQLEAADGSGVADSAVAGRLELIPAKPQQPSGSAATLQPSGVVATSDDGGSACEKGQGQFWLQGISLEVRPGELVCVVGTVASGKSSLVGAILGEMEVCSGQVAVGGRVAYVAQHAWMSNDTLRNNVLFGRPDDPARWELCIQACCLAPDLAALPGGAATEIGEKGINLSGGQKQRIALARALYAEADVYILDDPLSAVDVHVGRHIFEQCIAGALAGKARLLVTNQLQYLPAADRVVLLEAGRVRLQGSYQHCCQDAAFARLLSEFHASAGGQGGADGGSPSGPGSPSSLGSPAVQAEADQQLASPNGAPPSPQMDTARADNSLGVCAVEEREPDAALAGDPAGGQPDELAHNVAEVHNEPAACGAPGLTGDTASLPDAAPGACSTSEPDDEEHVSSSLPSSTNNALSRMSRLLHRLAIKVRLPLQSDAGGADHDQEAAGLLARSPARAARGTQRRGALVTRETRQRGAVARNCYWDYCQAYGQGAAALVLGLWSCEQSAAVLTQWWLARWTSAELDKQAAGVDPGGGRGGWLAVYLGLAGASILLTAARAGTNLAGCLRACRAVHRAALAAVVASPVAWFDANPIGRILNRFSKDTDEMDFMVPVAITGCGMAGTQLAGCLVLLCALQPWLLPGLAGLMLAYHRLQRFYRRSFIELARLDALSRSPVYAHFAETLGGLATLRAYARLPAAAARSAALVDVNISAYWSLRIADCWLSLRLDTLGAAIVGGVAGLAVATRGSLSVALTALALTQALDATQTLKALVQSLSNVEARFNCVDRLLEYSRLLPEGRPPPDPRAQPCAAEAEAACEPQRPEQCQQARTQRGGAAVAPPGWPAAGALEFEGVQLRYRPGLDLVLRGASFAVAPRDKVGIVGRTGSGKSSLLVALLRLTEPCGGAIRLDGLNLLALPLRAVRSAISVIPQEPLLFSGSVRTNLDPLSRCVDAELWDALRAAGLAGAVAGLPGGLSAGVAEGGDNFSVGQRQLLCVARALLRKPRVLVADEATASVDGETDALIQKALRAHFGDATVLTIAHRLNTILDSSKVLVMDAGRVREYDTVDNLLRLPGGEFRRLMNENGKLSVSGAASGV